MPANLLASNTWLLLLGFAVCSLHSLNQNDYQHMKAFELGREITKNLIHYYNLTVSFDAKLFDLVHTKSFEDELASLYRLHTRATDLTAKFQKVQGLLKKSLTTPRGLKLYNELVKSATEFSDDYDTLWEVVGKVDLINNPVIQKPMEEYEVLKVESDRLVGVLAEEFKEGAELLHRNNLFPPLEELDLEDEEDVQDYPAERANVEVLTKLHGLFEAQSQPTDGDNAVVIEQFIQKHKTALSSFVPITLAKVRTTQKVFKEVDLKQHFGKLRGGFVGNMMKANWAREDLKKEQEKARVLYKEVQEHIEL